MIRRRKVSIVTPGWRLLRVHLYSPFSTNNEKAGKGGTSCCVNAVGRLCQPPGLLPRRFIKTPYKEGHSSQLKIMPLLKDST